MRTSVNTTSRIRQSLVASFAHELAVVHTATVMGSPKSLQCLPAGAGCTLYLVTAHIHAGCCAAMAVTSVTMKNYLFCENVWLKAHAESLQDKAPKQETIVADSPGPSVCSQAHWNTL